MIKNINKGYAKRGVLLLLCVLLSVSFVLGACNFGKDKVDGATTDTAVTEEATTEVMNVVFASGITIGSTDISGMDYETAFKQVSLDAEKSIKDFTLTVTAGEEAFTYGKDNFKWSFNIEDTLKEAATVVEPKTTESGVAVSSKAYALQTEVEAESVNVIVEEVAKAVDVPAVDSTFSVDGDKVNISREKTGKALDKEDLTKKITDEANALVTGSKKEATVEAVLKDVEPKQKYEDFDGEIKLIGTYTTYSTNTLDGDHNMALALASCDGSVINPGEVWSFNECTGNSNLESLGYRPATVIINGKFEQGIGGGICQASTTIYNAAILANMDVEERYCHAYQSSYVPAGRDATIDYPYLDLKLSNPTEYPMYMQCYMEDAYLTVNIFGWDDPAFDNIEIESSIYGATKTSYRASASRIYYLDGKEVGREELPSSWYDYPDNGEEETSTAATKPKATKPKATKPKETKPQVTKPKETKPQVTVTEPQEVPTTVPVVPTQPQQPVTSDPVETAAPTAPFVPSPTSGNADQIPTATAIY